LQAVARKLATEMTATANITHSQTDPVGTHRFAYPVVREIPSRRSTVAHDAQTGRDDDADRALVALVYAARRGNEAAWSRLVARFDPMLRKVARSFRLGPADVDDVVQATWTRLYSHIGTLREPAAVGGWLATTARRQALHLLQQQAREQLVDDADLGAVDARTPESVALESELHETFMRAVAALPTRQRRVVTAIVAQPNLDYQQLGELLEMPVGSIGPTRARGLAVLERDNELRRLHLAAG
jgi:RNA polymerase sigma factor (sigma-70 family)